MTDFVTTNKGLTEPTVGGDSGTWGNILNTDIGILDAALGGSTALTNTTGAATLTTVQYQNLIFNVSGTLTGNVTYTIPSGVGGSWIINNTTTGSYSVTFSSGGGGASYSAPQSFISHIYSDGTNVYKTITAPVSTSSITVSAAATLTTAQIAGPIEFINGPYTVVIPNPSTAPGAVLNVFLNTTSTITLSISSGTFAGTGGNTSTTLALVPANATNYQIISDGTNWVVSTFPLINSSGNLSVNGSITATGIVTPRAVSITTATTITPTSATADIYEVTALASNTTIAIPSGSPVDGQKLTLRFTSNGTGGWTFTWTTSAGGYRIIGTTLPTTIVASKTIYVGCIYNSAAAFWDVVAVGTQA